MKLSCKTVFFFIFPNLCPSINFTMPQALRLRWDEFQENINLAFGSLRDDNDFSDVTLVCEDGKQMDAHKIILAASSPFFEKILERNKHNHPLIFLKGVKMEDLHSAMDFMYYGETNIVEDNLDLFLAVAKELMIKGLMSESIGQNGVDQKPNKRVQTRGLKDEKDGIKDAFIEPEFETFVENGTTLANNSDQAGDEEEKATIKVADIRSPEIQELEEKVNAMVTKTDHKLFGTEQWKRMAFLCNVCGLEGTNRNVRKHVESKHFERDPLPCNQCKKSCKTRRALGEHKMKYHEAKILQKYIEEPEIK